MLSSAEYLIQSTTDGNEKNTFVDWLTSSREMKKVPLGKLDFIIYTLWKMRF